MDTSFWTSGINAWLALLGLIVGVIFVVFAKKDKKSLLYPMLGFGIIAVVTGFSAIAWIGSWITVIMGWIAALSIGIFVPLAFVWALTEFWSKTKKGFKSIG